MNASTRPGVGTSGAPGHDKLQEDGAQRDLDEALEDTFPASDPIAITPEDDESQPRPGKDTVDEALEDTFPASDPPAPTQPRKK
ncbi:hypothetical protein ACILG0_14160 [Pseudomonadota bacterium AL_CKDN230030165-1A_HGKHYDSX7]